MLRVLIELRSGAYASCIEAQVGTEAGRGQVLNSWVSQQSKLGQIKMGVQADLSVSPCLQDLRVVRSGLRVFPGVLDRFKGTLALGVSFPARLLAIIVSTSTGTRAVRLPASR